MAEQRVIEILLKLRDELAGVTYAFSSSGKLVVESKDQMKRRGMRWPDLADAVCMTFASIAGQIGGPCRSMWVPGKPLMRRILGAG